MNWDLVWQIIVLLVVARILFPILGINKITWRK
jgi:hypothetical protein